MDAKNLINWCELSRVLSGNYESIRRNKIPIKYKQKVKELLMAVERVFEAKE